METNPLTPADLLVGVRNLPVRILEEHWEEHAGAPDSLLVLLSTGRDFSIRYDAGSVAYEVYERETAVREADELGVTGLSREALNELGNRVWHRYAEDVGQVSR